MYSIIAYHSNLYFDAFKQHVAEMKAKNFNTILFAITETDMRFNMAIFKEFLEYSESQAMQCWATFWGYNGVGEAICKECDLNKWLASVRLAGFRDIFVDEQPEHCIPDFLMYSDWFNFHLCLADNVFHAMSDYSVQHLQVSSFGVSAYMLGHRDPFKHITRTVEICHRLKRLRPDDSFIFIQGFGLPQGMEWLPVTVQKVAREHGIESFGFWSHRGCITGSIRSDNPAMVWEGIKM